MLIELKKKGEVGHNISEDIELVLEGIQAVRIDFFLY